MASSMLCIYAEELETEPVDEMEEELTCDQIRLLSRTRSIRSQDRNWQSYPRMVCAIMDIEAAGTNIVNS